MKLEANVDAVILRQSVQLQMKVSTSPGGVVGCGWRGERMLVWVCRYGWMDGWMCECMDRERARSRGRCEMI